MLGLQRCATEQVPALMPGLENGFRPLTKPQPYPQCPGGCAFDRAVAVDARHDEGIRQILAARDELESLGHRP